MKREVAIKEALDAHPQAVWWKRLPIIRHVRAIRAAYQVERHYALYSSIGLLPGNADIDYAVCSAIWRGEK